MSTSPQGQPKTAHHLKRDCTSLYRGTLAMSPKQAMDKGVLIILDTSSARSEDLTARTASRNSFTGFLHRRARVRSLHQCSSSSGSKATLQQERRPGTGCPAPLACIPVPIGENLASDILVHDSSALQVDQDSRDGCVLGALKLLTGHILCHSLHTKLVSSLPRKCYM